MTAVVAILNRQAIALSADSAVTHSGTNNRKIINCANKIFTLSKFHPVAIMIYNSAAFMTTLWETIIKVYRRQLGKKSFPTIHEYQEDFIKFLHSKNLFADDGVKKIFLKGFITSILQAIVKETLKGHGKLMADPTEANKAQILELIGKKVEELIPPLTGDVLPEFTDFDLDKFNAYTGPIVEEAIGSESHLRN
jgi:hypothetical protein